MSQLSFRQLWNVLSTGTLIAVGLLLAGPNGLARAGSIFDPLGDFLPTYTGTQDAGLDVLAHEVTLVGDRLNFFGRMAGPIAPTQAVGGLYLIGVDRGLGTPRFLNSPAAPPIIGPNVKWDAIVRILPDGTGFYLNSLLGVTTPLSTSDISIVGNEFNVSIPVSLMLPSATKPPEEWTYNLWPRNGVGLNVQVSDLAPDDGNSPVHVVPEPVSLTACAIGAFGLLSCRWRRGKHTARELVTHRQRKKNLVTTHLTPLGIAAVFAIVLSSVVEVRTAHAATGNIYNLGTLGGSSSAGSDINDAGQTVGSAQDAVGRLRPFLWDSSRGMTELGTANGFAYAWASAINASGSVAGTEQDSETGAFRAFAWTPNQANGTTGTKTNLAVQDTSFAGDINAAGQIVGHSTYSHFVEDSGCTPDAPYYPNCGGYWEYETNAVLWENGVGSDLTNRSAPEEAFSINNSGQVAGYFLYDDVDWHAFRYDRTPGNGVRHDLGTLGGSGSVGAAINNSGQVAGYSSTTGDAASHAFRYTGTPGAGGVMVDLGTLGGANSSAFNINDAGFVVGQADRSANAGGGSWATLWRNDAGNTAVDLDAWLDAINPTLGAYWRLRSAAGINNNGLVTGGGIYDDGPGGLTDGDRAFVLDASSLLHPIPGDFNNNGIVDAADYIVWRKTDGTPAGYGSWRTHFGQPAGGGSVASRNAAVPEPASIALLMLAATGWCFQRGRAA